MNITEMLKDSSLQDLGWLVDPDTFEPSDKDNDKKDDLEIEWGYGAIEPSQQDDMELAASPKEPVAEDKAVTVVSVAKTLLMRGITGKRFIAAMRHFCGDSILAKHKSKIAAVLAQEGIIGCIAIDSSSFKDCGDAFEFARKSSPYRRFIKFAVMNPDCPGCRNAMEKETRSQYSLVGGGSLDGFFEEQTVASEGLPVCTSCNLPIIGGMQDLQDEDMDDTLIDLMTVGTISREDADQIRGCDKSACQRIRDAFLLIERKADAKKDETYKAKVDTDGHVVESSRMEFDINPSPVGHIDVAEVESNRGSIDVSFDERPQIDVMGVEDNRGVIDVSFDEPLVFPESDLVPEEGMEIAVSKKVIVAPPQDVDVVDHSCDQAVELDDPASPFEVDDEKPDFRVDIDPSVASSIDVDPQTYVEPEFEGGDIFSLDDRDKPIETLHIDMRPI